MRIVTGTPGAVAPLTAIQIAGTDGTDLRAVSTDVLGRVLVIGEKVPQIPNAPAAATATLTSTVVLPPNPSRTGLILINTSAFPVSLAFGNNSAVLNSGVTLGTNAEFDMDGFSFFLGTVNAIGQSASCNLAIQEFS